MAMKAKTVLHLATDPSLAIGRLDEVEWKKVKLQKLVLILELT